MHDYCPNSLHFHREKEYESILVVELSKTPTNTVSLYSIDDDGSKVVKESFTLLSNGMITGISNSCHGLFIIRFGDSYFLFNPSTRYFAKVLGCLPEFDKIVGLCYDAYSKDYKVVVQPRHCGWNTVTSGVVAASLKSKRWAPVGFPFNAVSACEGPILNERLHWTVHEKIVRYDPHANAFEEFPSPTGNASSILRLGVSGGCLCMARRGSERYVEEKFEVLTMKEYGVGESWTTLFFIISSDFLPILFSKNCEVFLKKSVRKFWSTSLLRKRKSRSSNSSSSFLTKNGEILLLGKENMSRKLFAYNWRKNTTTDLDTVSNDNWWGAVSFVPNLTSPVGYERDAELHTESIQARIEWWRRLIG
ncbi:hypothetical protein LguiB_026215 [Lonicera macranthoides]